DRRVIRSEREGRAVLPERLLLAAQPAKEHDRTGRRSVGAMLEHWWAEAISARLHHAEFAGELSRQKEEFLHDRMALRARPDAIRDRCRNVGGLTGEWILAQDLHARAGL